MAPVPDLVRDSKLDTQFDPRYTQHVFYVSGLTPQRRKVKKEQRWVRERTIGTGGGGTVWLEKLTAEDEGDVRLRAVKEIKKEPQQFKRVDYSRELEAMAKFSNPRYEMCFVKFFGWYESLDANTIFIAMEYFKYGDLQRHLRSPLAEDEAQQITMQVLEGLVFMHDNGFAHRDLKPANIFVVSASPNWWVKIGDFGISKRTEEGRTDLRSFAGTPGFLAPEVLGQIDADADENSSAYTHAVDIWSAGEIAFRILVGEAPFGSMSTQGLYARGLMTFPTSVLLVRGISQSACDFVKSMMAPRAKDRLTAGDALAHVWMKSEDPAEDSSPSASSPLRVIEHLALDMDEEQNPRSLDPESLSAENNPFSVASGSWSTLTDEPAEKANNTAPLDPESLSAENNPFSVASGSWSTLTDEPAEKANNTAPLAEVAPEDPSGLGLSASSQETIQVNSIQNEPKTVSAGLAPGSLSRNWRQWVQDNHWIKMSKQLEFLRRVWTTLDEDHQIMQNQVLQVLVSKLREAVVKIEGVLHKRDDKHKNTPNSDSSSKQGEVKRWKYALVKDCLEKTVQDLDRWQNTFDPTWFLIMKIADPIIDQQLAEESTNSDSISTAKGLRGALADEPKEKTSIFLPEDGLRSAERHEVPYSTAQTVRRPNSNKDLILDPVICDANADVPTMTKDVRDLARRLSQTDPLTFGLLSCRGVVKTLCTGSQRVHSFDFVFNVPGGLTQPKSLRSILLAGDINHSLSDRFKVAKQLAKSANYIHTYQFVHKNIRPETIVVFQDRNSVLGAPFLLGFQKFRFVEGKTKRLGDLQWESDLYRHPRRQGLNPEEDYKMQHDIYSLGVCLLEIGLWTSFIKYADNADSALPSSVLCNVDSTGKDRVKKAFDIKNVLVNLAREDLPSRMGHLYTDIVINCLTCLDKENADFGDENEFQDADGVLVGVRYIEKILHQIDGIAV